MKERGCSRERGEGVPSGLIGNYVGTYLLNDLKYLESAMHSNPVVREKGDRRSSAVMLTTVDARPCLKPHPWICFFGVATWLPPRTPAIIQLLCPRSLLFTSVPLPPPLMSERITAKERRYLVLVLGTDCGYEFLRSKCSDIALLLAMAGYAFFATSNPSSSRHMNTIARKPS